MALVMVSMSCVETFVFARETFPVIPHIRKKSKIKRKRSRVGQCRESLFYECLENVEVFLYGRMPIEFLVDFGVGVLAELLPDFWMFEEELNFFLKHTDISCWNEKSIILSCNHLWCAANVCRNDGKTSESGFDDGRGESLGVARINEDVRCPEE